MDASSLWMMSFAMWTRWFWFSHRHNVGNRWRPLMWRSLRHSRRNAMICIATRSCVLQREWHRDSHRHDSVTNFTRCATIHLFKSEASPSIMLFWIIENDAMSFWLSHFCHETESFKSISPSFCLSFLSSLYCSHLLVTPRGGLRGPNHLGLLGPPVKFSGPLVGLLGLPWNSIYEFLREWINLPTKVVTNCRHNRFYNFILLAEQKKLMFMLKSFSKKFICRSSVEI